ncbi:alpha/beta hydrolase [Aurantiacibacter suaedae]|uniref:alpha/beta hydrolase n=1 Tax=Aurantiacibacter suaedae TaxID=2545755 RepID=UPI0010F46883|nr:alpha/beta hydrolase [Aurantiacibacter suaedae]
MSEDTLRPAVNARAGEYEREVLDLADACAAAGKAVVTASYGDAPHQRLDILAPAEPSGSLRPALVFCHGGGFTHGNRRWNHFMAPLVHAAGGVLVSIDYRLLEPGDSGPPPLEDMMAAMRWLGTHGASNGIDPAALFIGGHSAGAALAAAFALRPDLIEAAALPPGSLRGVLSISGSLHRWAITGTPGAGYALPDGPLPVDEGTPLALLDNLGVPMLVAWGGRERQRARVERSSMKLVSALADAGVDHEWACIEEADHFETHTFTGLPEHPLARQVRGWLERLGAPAPTPAA